MIPPQLIVVDLETNGLDFVRHEAVEVAWWNLTTDERGRFIPPHSPGEVLSEGSIEAFRINRYIDRIPGREQDHSGSERRRLWEQFTSWDEDGEKQARHTLVGANPRFDAHFLRKLFARFEETWGDPEPWHYRLWDVCAYAAGVLNLDALPGLWDLCLLLDVPAPDHSAEGDVTATGRCIQQLRARAGAR